jgi:hypothetical protein
MIALAKAGKDLPPPAGRRFLVNTQLRPFPQGNCAAITEMSCLRAFPVFVRKGRLRVGFAKVTVWCPR